MFAGEQAAGRLSYSRVRAISRLAGERDELVERLVEVAEHGTVEQLEVMVRGLRTVRDSECADVVCTEYVTHSSTEGSQWRLSATLDPEHGALVESALSAAAAAARRCPADALIRLAEIGLAALAADTARHELRGDEAARGGHPRPRRDRRSARRRPVATVGDTTKVPGAAAAR